MSPKERILIAGCGYVGTRLGVDLVRAGHPVWGLRRTVDNLPEGIEPLRADLLDRDALARALPATVDAVVYAASASRFDELGYREAYLDGLHNLLQILQGKGARPRRLIFVSSTGVYGQSDGQWVDETSEAMPARATGKVLLEAEQLALASLFPATIVRFSGIYGPGRARIVAQVRDGTARLRGGPPQWTNRIHRDDCARALAHVLALPHPEPIYVASDAEPAPHDAVVAWIAEHLGRPRPPVETGAGDGPRIRGQNKRCRSARLRASGFALRYPTFRDGYATLLG